MIRGFCKISKRTLFEEIDELRKQVSSGNAPPGVLPDAVEAIDAVRKIDNIGAHMEATSTSSSTLILAKPKSLSNS
jgi:hypothetical protein